MIKDLICIICPEGCHLKIDVDNDFQTTGNKCKRGITYGKQELTNPTRTVTSTVCIEGASYCRLPVKTYIPISKDLVFKCIKEINKVKVKSPIKMGDVIIHNILNTGINIVACRDM